MYLIFVYVLLLTSLIIPCNRYAKKYIMTKLKYTFKSSSCFTHGKYYEVRISNDKNYFITFDNNKDEIYINKSNFNL